MSHYRIVHQPSLLPVPVREGETLLGRSPYCTIVLDHPSVSREHAALKLRGDELWVEDLGSRNGTLVNGVRISDSTELTAGDYLTLGAVTVEVSSASSELTFRNKTDELPEQLMAAVRPPVIDESPWQKTNTTEVSLVSLGLVEDLILRAIERGRPEQLSALIRQTIERCAALNKNLTVEDQDRLALAAEVVSSWSVDESHAGWREAVLRVLGTRGWVEPAKRG